jgi:proteasome lid subunit RPN8/RPN11
VSAGSTRGPHPGPPAVHLPRAIADEILAQARAEAPLEACGLVIGTAPPGEGGIALRYVACRNAAASPVRYAVHPEDLLRVAIATDEADEAIWAIVHSHVTSPAVPSATDVDRAQYPEALYLVVSLAGEPSLRAWRIVHGAVHEVALEAA